MQFINLNYNIAILFFCLGLYVALASNDLIKKLFGLSLFQASVLWFYISLGKIYEAQPPILHKDAGFYSNPLPHVLMLTAIVVGVATMALGFALILRIEEGTDAN